MEVKDLQPKQVFEIFDQITKVPRPSKKEAKIRQYLLDFAAAHGIACKTDAIGNVRMWIPATPGHENAKRIALQGHMDMVAEKNSDVEHDFENDPIETVVDGEWVRAKGTTLGADNGIGVAAALAALTDKELVHGPLSALFTVDEETALTGATNLGEGMIEADILLNLDSEEEAEMCIGCAGGIDTTCTFKYTPTEAPADYVYFRIDFKGMQGGHSGTDINVGRACANKILVRFIWSLMQDGDVAIAELNGGNLRNAIAREAEAVIGVPAARKEELSTKLNAYIADITAEYHGVENIVTTIESVATPSKVIDTDTATRVVRALYSAPHGVISMSRDIEGLVETSTNLASVKMQPNNEILVTTSQRSSVESRKYDIANQVEALFTLAGATVTHGDGYPGWTPNPDSEILKLSIKAYEDLYGITPSAIALHAGLECGYFSGLYPDLDMVSFGPTLRDVHSPKERMHIPAVEKFWNHLRRIIEMVAKA